MIRFITIASLCMAALLVYGCQPPPVRLSLDDRSFQATDYSSQLNRWTRSKESYANLESRLFVSSTFLSWEFTQAQIAYRTKTEQLPATDVTELKKSRREATAKHHHFFIAAHTHEWNWNHLEDTSEDALWRVRLLNNRGQSVAPVSIERIGVRNGHYTALYPYYRDFYVAYKVTFPLANAQGQAILDSSVTDFTLRIGGPQAVVNLTWQVLP